MGCCASDNKQTTLCDVVIAASADDVWAKIATFSDITWTGAGAEMMVKMVRGSDADPVGAVREVTHPAPANLVIEEECTAYSAADRMYTYSVAKTPLPCVVQGTFAATVRVDASKDGCSSVTWTGTWLAADDAKEEEVEAARGMIKAGAAGSLANLKKLF